MKIEELFKILMEDKPSISLKKREDELFLLIPELKICKGFNQHNEWHIYDVYEHILHVVDGVDADINLRIAALFHDIGKPICYSMDDNGVGHFYKHYVESNKIYIKFANKYNLDIQPISKLIYYHDLRIEEMNDSTIRKKIESFSLDEIKLLFKIKRADLLAQNPKYRHLLSMYDEQEKHLINLKTTK